MRQRRLRMTEAGQAAYPGGPDNVLQAAETTQSWACRKKKKSTDKARVEMDDKQRSVAVESCRRGSSCKARRLEMIKSDWE